MPSVLTDVVLLVTGLFMIGASAANMIVFKKARDNPAKTPNPNAPSEQTYRDMYYLNIAFIGLGGIMVLIAIISLIYKYATRGTTRKKL